MYTNSKYLLFVLLSSKAILYCTTTKIRYIRHSLRCSRNLGANRCYVVTQLPRIYLSALIGHHQNFEIRLRHTLITGPLAQNHSCTEISRHQILKTLIQ